MEDCKLFADKDCWVFKKSHPGEFSTFGCGPGGIGDFLVPDTIYGLRVSAACRIHDWGYRFSKGNSEEDRERHDRIFKNNLIRIVRANTKSKLMLLLRMRRVKTYYYSVRFFGGPAYWSERNSESELELEFETEQV